MQLGNVRVPQFILENICHLISYNIQGDLGEMSVIWGSDNIRNCEKKEYVNMCLILNCYREREREREREGAGGRERESCHIY
jgi:hypothetical protein